MRRTTILNAKEVRRTTFREAEDAFFKHCALKNLRPRSLEYYREDLHFFHASVPLKYANEISQEVFENFIINELERGDANHRSTIPMTILSGFKLSLGQR